MKLCSFIDSMEMLKLLIAIKKKNLISNSPITDLYYFDEIFKLSFALFNLFLIQSHTPIINQNYHFQTKQVTYNI